MYQGSIRYLLFQLILTIYSSQISGKCNNILTKQKEESDVEGQKRLEKKENKDILKSKYCLNFLILNLILFEKETSVITYSFFIKFLKIRLNLLDFRIYKITIFGIIERISQYLF